MAPTILIAGATGNTGRSVVETLSKFLETNSAISGHRIVALTRSANGAVAQRLAQLPGVEVVEQNWIEITADWLREHHVVRAFVASQVQAGQFAEESSFLLAALHAGVKYVVRISTTAPNVRPDSPAFYPRSHWALETLLSAPAFKDLQWTSLQPNAFSNLYFHTAAELVNNYRATGKQDTLRLVAAKDAPVGVIDADEVGTFAAHLLAEEDPSRHNQRKYVLNGPEDVTGQQIVDMVEKHIGTKVEDVRYEDVSFVEQMAAHSPDSKSLILSIKHAVEPCWRGECTASTTSKEVLEIAAPKRTPIEMFKALLKD
jgi:uncharacterized protein YbjT (DUF2867 family)